ncbi:MAG: hypothetical protein JXB48_24645 [Candidatus Latescibacteria bacterium]|nr:hypothetical protein [Candidatus Latescibacterota bacterium]
MKTLIIKTGATGDVLRTTPLLRVLPGDIYWLTEDKNECLLKGLERIRESYSWSSRNRLHGRNFDTIINLEDSTEAALIIKEIAYEKLSGAYIDKNDTLTYTDDLADWFDLSLISRYGKKKADELKLLNRRTYQEMLFSGLGYRFEGEKYMLANYTETDLHGDVAIAPKAGSVWPNKNWAFFSELKKMLENDGYRVNYLPQRATLYEHFGDIRNHQYCICGDSLPMHVALGFDIKCCSIFTCTSPWEIYEYGLLKKIISPRLDEYFYSRNYDVDATTTVDVESVHKEVLTHLK